MPCVFTNCHNCLCAVGGTINTDVHKYAESACRKSGGIFVPPHEAVIHQYMREMIVNSGDMSIVSDSHTRYGTQGSVSIGEGGPELAKAMLGKYYEIDYPGVIAVLLTGTPKPWVGPMDVALSIIGKVFKNNFVKNKVLEFIGPGVHSLSMDFRNGIDTMTTESACLSSVWATDDKVKEYFEIHKRPQGFKEMVPGNAALYDGVVEVNLDTIVPMIALPFHPSNAYPLADVIAEPEKYLKMVEKEAERVFENNKDIHLDLCSKIHDGKIKVDQAATLLDIKSRMLLPKVEKEEEEDEEDPRAELVRRLLEYKMYKYMAQELEEREQEAELLFFKEPTIPREVAKYEEPLDLDKLLDGLTLAKLQKVFDAVMKRNANKLDPVRSRFSTIRREPISLEQKVRSVLSYAREHRHFKFSDVLERESDRLEIVVAFLAVLELMRMGRIHLVQEKLFDEMQLDTVDVDETEDEAELELSTEEGEEYARIR